MSYSVLRRYTPPTCTLEILAKQSPLSRWAGQPVLKQVRFQLNLDDPKLPQDQWVTLKGDRAQLDALSDAVQTYVQSFLGQSHSRLNLTASPLYVDEASLALAESTVPLSASEDSAGVSLQPAGRLSHTLILGSLATAESGPSVSLSTLQLFDLANALEEHTADALALPNLERPAWLRPVPAWGRVAAVSLLVVGLSASVVKLLDGTQGTETAMPTTSQGASSSDQRIANQLPATVTATPTPLRSSNQPLPPPPPPGALKSPPPGLPTVNIPQAAPINPALKQPNPSGAGTLVPQPPRQPTVIAGNDGAVRIESDRSRPVPPIAAAQPRVASAPAPTESLLQAAPSQAMSRAAAPASESPPGTAFDTIPQVAEARRYFQQRWTPPEGLTQTLEYRLLVDAQGQVEGIIPLGQAAGDYVDRTGIPLVGERLVSPLKSRPNAKIRLVLSPDGTVQTFLE